MVTANKPQTTLDITTTTNQQPASPNFPVALLKQSMLMPSMSQVQNGMTPNRAATQQLPSRKTF